jgi:hypothetical protein
LAPRQKLSAFATAFAAKLWSSAQAEQPGRLIALEEVLTAQPQAVAGSTPPAMY